MDKLVTIFVLTYNRPDFLAQCLESIRNQTFRDFRVVVLDNASEKDNVPLIEQFHDLELEYVRHPRNLLATGNFRIAWSQAGDSKYLMIFHDDDVMHPRLIEEDVAVLETDEQLAWVASSYTTFEGQPPSFHPVQVTKHRIFDYSEIAREIIRGVMFCFSSVLYRASLTPTVDYDDLVSRHSIYADRPLLLRLAAQGKCALIDEPLVLYRQHPNQDSKTGPLNEDNLIELYVEYRRALSTDWTIDNQRLFFAWTGFELMDSYFRLSPLKRSPLYVFLRKAYERDVLRWGFLSRYPLRLVTGKINRMRRVATMNYLGSVNE